MKFSFIFGKGIDGCGVTRGALIFEKWLVAQGHDTVIVDFDNEQCMTRADSANFIGDIVRVESDEEVVRDDVVDIVNATDVAIFHSYPTRKTSTYIERFRLFLEKIDKPIKVMHDHGVSSTTINLIPQAGEYFSHADVLVPQSLEGLSARAFTQFDPSLEGRVIENPIWIDPEVVAEYDLPLDQRRQVLNYTGRSSPIKEPGLICKIIPQLLEDGWRGELIGAERSINTVQETSEGCHYQPKYRHLIKFYSVNKVKAPTAANPAKGWIPGDHPDPPITAYSRYEYSEGMSRLGSSMASWAGYRCLDPRDYGCRMEYTQIEAALLTVPIMNCHFIEHGRAPDGKLWKDHDLFLCSDLNHIDELAATLRRLANDPEEWRERHERARAAMYEFYHVEQLAPTFLNRVLQLGKKNKGKTGLELISWWSTAADHRSQGDIVMSTATAILNQKKMVLIDGRQSEVRS